VGAWEGTTVPRFLRHAQEYRLGETLSAAAKEDRQLKMPTWREMHAFKPSEHNTVKL